MNERWPAHSRPPLNLRRHKYQQPIEMEMTMTTDAETLVRRAYQLAEGNVMDVQGFVDLFADDGEINAGTSLLSKITGLPTGRSPICWAIG
jgi:hypothetical protein